MRRNPLIAAVDTSDADDAEALAARLVGLVAYLKVGLELFTAGGPDVVRRLAALAPVFLDLKLHDIPTTVHRAARNAARLGVELLTVHALGGPEMVRAAVEGAAEGAAGRPAAAGDGRGFLGPADDDTATGPRRDGSAARGAGERRPAILAVTVLSSVGGESLASPASLAFEAVQAGAAGVVTSGHDVATVREVLGAGPLVVVPGIRPGRQPANDHVRVLTPGEALERGADLLVVGRPVTASPDPAAAARGILREMGIGGEGAGA